MKLPQLNNHHLGATLILLGPNILLFLLPQNNDLNIAPQNIELGYLCSLLQSIALGVLMRRLKDLNSDLKDLHH